MLCGSGLTGITLKPVTLAMFFLIAPEMIRLYEKMRTMAKVSTQRRQRHHWLSLSVSKKHMNQVEKLHSEVVENNPSLQNEGCLTSIVTRAMLSEEV